MIRKIKLWVLLSAILILTILLFVSSTNEFSPRILRKLWESGHFLLFMTFSFVLINYTKLKILHFSKKLITLTLVCLFLAFTTETLQLLVGRNFEYKDIINDLLGGLSGLLLSQLFIVSSYLKKSFLTLTIIMLFFIGSFSFWFSLFDEWQINQAFPSLANFESKFEIQRWQHNNSRISISTEYKNEPKNSLKIDFFPAKYPGISLKHFIKDWHGYRKVHFHLYNPEKEKLNLTFKIYDQKHAKSGYRFNDRFNKRVDILPGSNDVSFSLEEIKSSPQKRQMNMQKIFSLSLFMTNLEKPTSLYLEKIYLKK